MKLRFLLLPFLSFILLITIDALSIFTMLLFASFGMLLHQFFFKTEKYLQYLSVFSFYTIIAILLYWSNISAFPLNYGCTGAELGGTDDLFFFQEATNNGVSYRGDRSDFMHNYSMALEQVHFFLSVFKTTNLIDLMFVNIFFLSFIPFFTRNIIAYFSDNQSASRLGFYLAICSSFLMQNSLVLVRDGITAAFFIGVFYFFLKKRYALFFLFLFGLFYLRIVGGLLTVLFIVSYMLYFGNSKNALKYILIFTGLFFAFMPIFLTNLDRIGVLESGLFREEFFDLIKDNSGSTSGAVFIYSLPFYLRIPLGTFYFIGSPFINIEGILTKEGLTFWHFFDLFYGVAFLFYSIYIAKAFFTARKKGILFFLLLSFVFLAMLFSQISLQIRHKTMLMPLVFIIVALSFYEAPLRLRQRLVILVPFVLLTLQVIYNLKKNLF